MCKYCNNFKNEELQIDYVDACIRGQQLILNYDAYSTDSSFSVEVEINFCPICGSTLLTDERIQQIHYKKMMEKAERDIAMKEKCAAAQEIRMKEYKEARIKKFIEDGIAPNTYCNKFDIGNTVEAYFREDAKALLGCSNSQIKCLAQGGKKDSHNLL